MKYHAIHLIYTNDVQVCAGIAIILAGTFLLVSAILAYIQYRQAIVNYEAEISAMSQSQSSNGIITIDCLGCMPPAVPSPPAFDNSIVLRVVAGVAMYGIGGLVLITGIRKI